LLEAMACGVPVLSSDASSLPEVGGEGAALLLSPHDEAAWSAALIDLLGDDAARGRLRQAGFARSARFKWSAAARDLAALYRRLLAADTA
jgi:glycosyltransferase involved in cell wall biosynthesis